MPITVDSVNAPAMRPAAVPQSYLKSFAAATVVTRLVTQRTTVSETCVSAFFLRPAEELRPDLVAGREEEEVEEDELDDRVDLDADLADDDAREQRADDVSELERPDLMRPTRKPRASVRKIASSGFCLRRGDELLMPRSIYRVTKRSHGVPTRRRTRTLKTS